MNTIIFATAAIFAAGMASATTIAGCEVVDMGGYYNKADATCNFNTPVGSRVLIEGQTTDNGTLFADNGDLVADSRSVSDR